MMGANSVPSQVLEAVANMVNQTGGLYAQAIIGALPADNGIALQIAVGAPETTFLPKSTVSTINIVINAKHIDQLTAADTLANIHQNLTQRKKYPSGDGWSIANIITNGAPSYLDREQNSQWLYGSSVAVRFYYQIGRL